MNHRREQRNVLGLTQSEAAQRAGISLATWRRWERDPQSVSAETRAACERVVAKQSEFAHANAASVTDFAAIWRNSPLITARQAYAIAIVLTWWAETELAEWVRRPDAPLHQIAPFEFFDLRVMMLVGESRAWAEAVRQRCYTLSDEIEAGTLPFDRQGPLIDEVLFGAALRSAPDILQDMPELFDQIPPRASTEEEESEDYAIKDDDWDFLGDNFDDQCQWDEWAIPLSSGHPLLPAVLADRHPYTWFDRVEPPGPGSRQRLMGLVIED